MTKKVVLVVEYNGSEYKGWQAQKFGVPSVQENLEKALAIIANHPVKVVCAGRNGLRCPCKRPSGSF